MKHGVALLLGGLSLLAACKRPVEGRSPAATRLLGVTASPVFLRAGVPLELTIRLEGEVPATLALELAGASNTCAPELRGEGELRCVFPPLDPSRVPEGATLIIATASDPSGRSSIVSTPVTVDFSCPRAVAMTVSSGAVRGSDLQGLPLWVAAPGDTLVATIEASEDLVGPPQVSRFGSPYTGVEGQGRTFGFSRVLGPQDAPQPQPIVARLVDRAGNSSLDCGGDGALLLAVDAVPPLVDGQRVHVRRDAPGLPSTITASIGAFLDDVGVREVRLYDDTRSTLIATVVPNADGSVDETSLRAQPTTRLLAVAVDLRGRESPPTSVTETWRLSLGSGSLPGAALRTGARYSLAPPDTTSLRNQTAAGAPDVLAADGRAIEVRAVVGFERAGELPSFFESRWDIIGGYDRVGDAVVAFGGALGFGDVLTYSNRTTILRWDEGRGVYRAENGPAPDPVRTPTERRGRDLAFDDAGCGVMFGGDGILLREGRDPTFFFLNDVWQLCGTPSGYRWQAIQPRLDGLDEPPLYRIAPLTYDPSLGRYVVIQGQSAAFGRAFDDGFYLLPGPTPDTWSWAPFPEFPERFNSRRGHLQFWDPRLGGLTIALGGVRPIGQGEQGLAWVRRQGQWLLGTVPRALEFREGFGRAFDLARQQLVLFGGDDVGGDVPQDGALWLMTDTATHGATAWRRSGIDPVLPRFNPTVVYDAAREVTLIFGGVRGDRFVPAEVQAVQLEPTWPVVQATLDLGASKPAGLWGLDLVVRAQGQGDADGTGPEARASSGVEVYAWDFSAGAWTRLAEGPGPELRISVGSSPDRFVSPRGTLVLSVRASSPATEALDASLTVDLIDGHLALQGGVPLR